jgi:hypothetical protein
MKPTSPLSRSDLRPGRRSFFGETPRRSGQDFSGADMATAIMESEQAKPPLPRREFVLWRKWPSRTWKPIQTSAAYQPLLSELRDLEISEPGAEYLILIEGTRPWQAT